MRELWLGFKSVFVRELAIHAAQSSEWLIILLFYFIIVSLFPIAMGNVASTLAIPIIWVAVLLTTFIAQENILRIDYRIGIFDQMLLSPYPFSWLLLAKMLAHWLIYAVPMILLTPLLALSFSLSAMSIVVLLESLLWGTLVLFLLGGIGSALTVSLARGGVLLAILILPLYVPVLVLGSSIGILSAEGIQTNGQMALLAALAIVTIFSAPLAAAYAIRVSIN